MTETNTSASSESVPTLAVIIVSWNVRELLNRCLTSLQDELVRTEVQADVWVVDNASADGSAEMVQQKHPWVHLDDLNDNLGYVRGNNRILQRLLDTQIPDYIWLLNPDTEVQEGTTQELISFFETHSNAGLVGPQLLNPDNSLQPGAFRFPNAIQPLFDFDLMPMRLYYSRLNGRYPDSTYANGSPFPIDHPLGAAMLARGRTIKDVGLLDEQFFMYCEEIDWAWRMHKTGWSVWMVPQAKVIHHGGASSRQARPQTTAYLWESRAKLYRKHCDVFTRTFVRGVVRWQFSKKLKAATNPEWETAYRRILEAWK